MSAAGPPKVDHDISTLDSLPISWPAGGEDSANDTQSAQRQSTFQFLIPVRRLSVVKWILARSSTRTTSTMADLLTEVAPLYECASFGLVEVQPITGTNIRKETLEMFADNLLVG